MFPEKSYAKYGGEIYGGEIGINLNLCHTSLLF